MYLRSGPACVDVCRVRHWPGRPLTTTRGPRAGRGLLRGVPRDRAFRIADFNRNVKRISPEGFWRGGLYLLEGFWPVVLRFWRLKTTLTQRVNEAPPLRVVVGVLAVL